MTCVEAMRSGQWPNPYRGVLVKRKMRGRAKAALCSWQDQRQRCLNPRAKSYRWYGAKGVRVLYSSRDFIGWWLSQPKPRGRAVCDRIDPEGDYTFGNIQLITQSENSTRMENHKTRPVIHVPSGRKFYSLTGAARWFRKSVVNIHWHCNGRSKVQLFKYGS